MGDGLYLGIPPGHSWPLTAADLRCPDAAQVPDAPPRRASSGATARQVLDFEVPLADASRYGSEEFSVLLPNIDVTALHTVAQRIVPTVAATAGGWLSDGQLLPQAAA